MAGIPFNCGTDNELCFNSGVCVRNDTQAGEFCECPDGYIHDLVGGRFPNCALPTWFLPAYFAVATAGSLWALFLILPDAIFRVRSRLQWVALLYCVSVTLEWLHVLCVFVQQANALPALVFRMIFSPVALYMSYLMFRIIIDPICDALGGKVMSWRRVAVKGYFTLLSIALLIVQGSMLAFADVNSQQERETFSVLFVIQMFLNTLGYTMTAVIMWLMTKQLMRTIQSFHQPEQNHAGQERLAYFLKQLHALSGTSKALGLNIVVLLPVPICILVLGSMPYQFVFWAINTSGIWPTAYIARKVIRLEAMLQVAPRRRRRRNRLRNHYKSNLESQMMVRSPVCSRKSPGFSHCPVIELRRQSHGESVYRSYLVEVLVQSHRLVFSDISDYETWRSISKIVNRRNAGSGSRRGASSLTF